MKNMKIDEKSKFLSAVLLAIVLCGLVFFFGYKKLEEKADRFNADNASLESRIKSLETYYKTEEQNKKDTEEMTKLIADVFAQYPGDARFEDGIYEAFDLYEASDKSYEFESVGFSANAPVKVIPAEIVTAAGIEAYNNSISFNHFDVSYNGKVTYEGLKGMVRDIAVSDYNLAIAQMAYKIEDDGYISGNALLSFYSVKGAGCPYEEPPVVAYETGLENLFGVHDVNITFDEGEN